MLCMYAFQPLTRLLMNKCYHYTDGSDFNISYPHDAEVVSPNLGSGSDSGLGSDHSGYGYDSINPDTSRSSNSPRKADDDDLDHCFNVTIIGDSIVEGLLEYIALRVDFGDIFVHNITLIILDDDSEFQYRWIHCTCILYELVCNAKLVPSKMVTDSQRVIEGFRLV